jgi:hypothetical protein
VYKFSLPPWQLAELALPNVSGKLYPQRNHWTFLIPDGQSIWFPTIYQGIIPLILAISVMTLRRRKDMIAAMLSWVLILTLFAALGTFSLGWIWNQIAPTTTIAPTNFSLYWLITNTIPEYIDFRYPAKWFVLTSLMLALLASRGWDQFIQRLPQIRQHVFLKLSILGTVFTLIGIIWWPYGPFFRTHFFVRSSAKSVHRSATRIDRKYCNLRHLYLGNPWPLAETYVDPSSNSTAHYFGSIDRQSLDHR